MRRTATTCLTTESQRGITLIELLMGVAIVSIIMGWGLPTFKHQIKTSKLYSEQQQLVTLLNAARLGAVTSGQKVTICPSETNSLCGDQWSHGYLAFIDKNGNRKLDRQDKIIFQYHAMDKDMRIKWRAFGNRKTLQWLPTGITNHQNGSFEICLNGDPRYARALVLSKMGRLRRTTDSNNNGIDENASGIDINCN